MAQKADMTHRIRLRPRTDVTPQSRFLFVDRDGSQRTFDVTAVSNTDEANRDIELIVVERYKVAG